MMKIVKLKIHRKLVVCWLVCLLVTAFPGLVSSGFAATGSSATPEALYESARKSYYKLLESSSKKAYRENWMDTIQMFQKVIRQHPVSYESYKATFTVGRLYHDLASISGLEKDLMKAADHYESVVTRFPVNRLTDDALYHLAEIHLSRNKTATATSILQKIVKDYPEGDQLGAARKMLATLEKEKPVKALPVPAVDRARLYDLGYENGPNQAQITLKAEGNVTFAREGESKDRIQLVFRNARWDSQIPSEMEPQKGLLKQVHLLRNAEGNPRLEVRFDGGEAVKVKSRLDGDNLVLSFKAVESRGKEKALPVLPLPPLTTELKKPESSKPKPAPQEAPKETKEAKQMPASPKKAERKKGELLIVLDPGHGGKDDGAKGRTGLLEKQVNLEIASRVQKILKKRYKIKSVLTRTDDTFIELKDRGDIANRMEADLFVSIHANAAPRRSARGIETYFLGSGSSDRALETAARENGELVESVEDDEVQQILASLISTTKINESARLAADVQKRLAKLMSKKYSNVNDLGVKEGPFYVLHRTNMPSILVEVGFVTNRYEERRLKQNSYQYWLAESIAQGIVQFLKDKAPSI